MTRQDKVGQSETRQLSVEQETAIGALLTGATDAEAGEKAGVSRASVARWKSADALFIAVLNSERQRQWDDNLARLESLQGRALSVLGAALDSPDDATSFRAAQAVIKLRGERPTGPTSEWDAVAKMAGY
jgi:hypothetical protein